MKFNFKEADSEDDENEAPSSDAGSRSPSPEPVASPPPPEASAAKGAASSSRVAGPPPGKSTRHCLSLATFLACWRLFFTGRFLRPRGDVTQHAAFARLLPDQRPD